MASDATLLRLASVYSLSYCTCIAFIRKDCFLLEVQYLQCQTRGILTNSYDLGFKLNFGFSFSARHFHLTKAQSRPLLYRVSQKL
jgi:hypothetical protein